MWSASNKSTTWYVLSGDTLRLFELTWQSGCGLVVVLKPDFPTEDDMIV